jgi:alkylation response protein AidB-like acyl-CoA dehydrogenase
MLFPSSQAQVIDTWQVAGLRGTGSVDFAVSDLFVPHRCTVSVADDPCRESGTLYRFPQRSAWGTGFAAAALGVARGALDALIELAQRKAPDGGPEVLREQPVVQAQLGEAEAHLRAGRALLAATLRETWDAARTSGQVTVEQRVSIRLATTHAIRLSARVVDVAYNAAGSSAIRADSPLQRRFQDVHVITQHVLGRQAHYQTAGRFLLGLEPDLQWI